MFREQRAIAGGRASVMALLACLVSLSVVAPSSAETPPSVTGRAITFGGGRLEAGLDVRYLMVTPTATYMQQWLGLTAAFAWPVIDVGGDGPGAFRLDLGGETGLSGDSTGLCRYIVRCMEVDAANVNAAVPAAYPDFSADLLFSTPLHVPLRPRVEADLTLLPGWSVQVGGEVAIVLLLYESNRAEIRMDAGLSLGTRVRVADGFGLGMRARICTFGDIDQWPGAGLTLYGAFY